QAQGPLLIHEGLTETGVWKLTTPDRETVYYVVQPDAREADLTPFDDADREKVGKFLPFAYENDVDDLVKGLSQDSKRQYFWLCRYEMKLVARSTARVLLTLRVLALTLLVLLVGLQPVYARTAQEELPGRVILAVDVSDSMHVPDPQRDPVDKLRLARALKI